MLDDLKKRLAALGYVPTPADGWLLEYCLRKADREVRDSCGLPRVPKGLECAAVDRAAGEFLLVKGVSPEGLPGLAGAAVKSISEGDTSVTFAEGATPEQKLESLIAHLLQAGGGAVGGVPAGDVVSAPCAMRGALESLYAGRCTVTVRRGEKDPETRVTKQTETVLAEDVPCRLSFGAAVSAGQASPAAGVGQSVKLFLAPETEVPPGSGLTVAQNGYTGEYACSGEPARYASHQEIGLELFRGWA